MRRSYTPEERDIANDQCIIRYLQSIGHPLTKEGASGYWRSRERSSLVIRERDGYYNWNAQGVSGFKPIELAKQLLMQKGYTENQALVTAVHDLAALGGYVPRSDTNQSTTSNAPKQSSKSNEYSGQQHPHYTTQQPAKPAEPTIPEWAKYAENWGFRYNPAKYLPHGWGWQDWDDGSGYLVSPDGKVVAEYDLAAKEYKFDKWWRFMDDKGLDKEFLEGLVREKYLPNVIQNQPNEQKALEGEEREYLIIPEKAINNSRAIDYLINERGIDRGIISDCIDKGKIYQTKKFGNIAFVSRCKDGEIKHIFLRGTMRPKSVDASITKGDNDYTRTSNKTNNNSKAFRMDSKGSDKNYPFVLEGKKGATTVYVFESAIDALSHATLCKLNGHETSLHNAHRISLHGTSFGALRTFLADNPQVTTIIPCLDADEAGHRRSKKMQEEFGGGDYGGERHDGKRYTVENHRPPKVGNDYNEMLLNCKEFGVNKPQPPFLQMEAAKGDLILEH